MLQMNTDSPRVLMGTPRWPGGNNSWDSAIADIGPQRAAASADGAFAIGTRLPDGRSFLAVDRFARETLCWRVDGERIRFAERADSLGGTELDPQAIFDYLFFHAVPSPRTIF